MTAIDLGYIEAAFAVERCGQPEASAPEETYRVVLRNRGQAEIVTRQRLGLTQFVEALLKF